MGLFNKPPKHCYLGECTDGKNTICLFHSAKTHTFTPYKVKKTKNKIKPRLVLKKKIGFNNFMCYKVTHEVKHQHKAKIVTPEK